MVKMLDPNNPSVRETLQNIVTINFADLVKSFPMVAFHTASQRFAVGTNNGQSIIYDLRTATKQNILEGHVSPVHGISFSPNGKLVASLAACENKISFWTISQGFLESLKGAFGTAHPPLSLPIGVGRMKPYRTFAMGKPNPNVDIGQAMDAVRFEWTGERSLRIFSVGGMELAFQV
jgi:WD40 repeat protein